MSLGARTIVEAVKGSLLVKTLCGFKNGQREYGFSDQQVIIVSGATGPFANKINGVYKAVGETYNDRPLFRKQGDEIAWFRSETKGFTGKHTKTLQ